MPLSGSSVHHVCVLLLEPIEQLGYLLRRILEVVVHRHHDAAARGSDSCEQGVVLPVVPHHVEAANARLRSRERGDPLPAFVGAPVVDEHELVRAVPERFVDAPDELGKRSGAVLDRDHDRKRGLVHGQHENDPRIRVSLVELDEVLGATWEFVSTIW